MIQLESNPLIPVRTPNYSDLAFHWRDLKKEEEKRKKQESIWYAISNTGHTHIKKKPHKIKINSKLSLLFPFKIIHQSSPKSSRSSTRENMVHPLEVSKINAIN